MIVVWGVCGWLLFVWLFTCIDDCCLGVISIDDYNLYGCLLMCIDDCFLGSAWMIIYYCCLHGSFFNNKSKLS